MTALNDKGFSLSLHKVQNVKKRNVFKPCVDQEHFLIKLGLINEMEVSGSFMNLTKCDCELGIVMTIDATSNNLLLKPI